MSLEALSRPTGGFWGLDRWVVPQRFLSWTDTTPERYVIKLPLAPAMVLTCSADDCRAIFTERNGALLFGEGLRRMAPHEALFGHDALSSLDGEDHTRFRRQLTGAFHGEALKGYEAGIVEVTRRHVTGWSAGQAIPFASLTQPLARDVIATTIFGVRKPGRARRLQAALDRLDDALNSLELAGRFAVAILMRGRWAPFPRIAAIHQEIEAITLEEIAERRSSPETDGRRRDCLDRFLHLDPDTEGPIADEEIVAAMRVLVIAGWATTANTLAWMAERLARNPEALAACRAEVTDGGSRYLTATVQETLRMRPPVPITVRYAARDFEMNGVRIPHGTLVATDIERMHFRPDLYPEPRRFRPERFIENRPGTYTWIPFGGGVHRCIGAGFALTEARLILQTILQSFTFARDESRGERSKRGNLITAPGRQAMVTLLPV